MMPARLRPCLAIVNRDADVAHCLKTLLEFEGFAAVVAPPPITGQHYDLSSFLDRVNPALVIYDIPPPYQVNCAAFLHMHQREAEKGRRFIITTTDQRLVSTHLDRLNVDRIVSIPFDLCEVVQVVHAALDAATVDES